MSVGEALRSHRLARGLTCEDVAYATHMKVQTVEALEAEAFDRIPAPLYVKGFIRLYASYLGLDPKPLIAEYEARKASEGRPVEVSSTKPAPWPGVRQRRDSQPLARSSGQSLRSRAEDMTTSLGAIEGPSKKEAAGAPRVKEDAERDGGAPRRPQQPFVTAAQERADYRAGLAETRSSPGKAPCLLPTTSTRTVTGLATRCKGALSDAGRRMWQQVLRIRGRWQAVRRRRVVGIGSLEKRRVAGVILGLVMLLVLAVSGLTRFFAPRSPSPASPSRQFRVRLAAEPPELYMD